MNRYVNMIWVALIFSFNALSQTTQNTSWQYASAGIQYYKGTSIGKTFKRLRNSNPYSIEVYIQKQNNVSPAWNNTKRLPQWGLGISITNTGSKQYIGTVVCAYPYIKFPLFTSGALQSNLRFSFGLGWVEKPYNETRNPKNLLLSQKINTLTQLMWQNEVRISPKHFLNTAVSFYHLSNAKTRVPNLGMNIPAISLGYRYAFHGETKKPVVNTDTLNKKPFVKIFLSGGVKQMQVPDSSYFFVKALTVEAGKQISHSSTFSVGMLITHDRSVATDPLVKNPQGIKTVQAATYVSYEYSFGRFSIPVQVGVFVYNSNAVMVEAFGARYKLNKKWTAQFLLKSHLYRADMMHLGIGYKFQ